MNQVIKRLVAGSLAFCLFALLLVEFTTDEPGFLGGLVSPTFATPRLAGGLIFNAGAQRRTTQSPRSSFVSDLFRNNCARCHGADGRADTPLGRTYQTPDLTDPEWWRTNSKITNTGSLISIVSRGKGGMPAFGKKLKRTEIRALVGYVRKFKKRDSTNR